MLFAASASAQVEAIVVGEVPCLGTCPAPFYSFEAFGFGQPHRYIDASHLRVVESAPDGRLFGLESSQPPRLVEVFPDGTRVPRGGPLPDLHLVHDLTVARSGIVYVLGAIGTNGRILALAPDGAVLATYDAGPGMIGEIRMDLAADQCTLAYTAFPQTVRRFNVCTGSRSCRTSVRSSGLSSTMCASCRMAAFSWLPPGAVWCG